MILIDTHPLVWFAQGVHKLGRLARQILQDNLAKDQVVVSPISFWEVSMLVAKRRLVLGRTTQAWMETMFARGGIGLAEISPEIAIIAGELGCDIHGDPADRLIIATARANGCSVMTADRQIIGYGEAGHLSVIDARR